MPNPQHLTILTELREAAGLTLTQMARRCGLTGKQSRLTAGAWERGEYAPDERRRRTRLIGYLWDDLGLRRDPTRFEAVWDVLVNEWGWAPMEDAEWSSFTNQPRTQHASAATNVPARPFQAPAGIPHFVGRQGELQATCALLTNANGPPILALIGMGGIGKSTLAIHTAHALRQHFRDGILWANAAITHPLDVAQSWAQTYGYDFSGLSDLESRAAALRTVLAEKQVLLIFDDVLDAANVRPLLPGGEQCRVLLTTRNHDVASALNAHVIAPPELPIDAGVELMAQVLDHARVHAELEAAQRICAIVEGLPLAVEIVAQRLKSRPMQSLGNMVARLEDSAQRLDLKVSDRAIRAAFEVSWAQLDNEQRHIFATMGVFEGRSFALPALVYIAERTEAEVEEVVWSLQALSLVGVDSDVRYRQHPLLADFASEVLGAEAESVVQLCKYYQEFAQNIEPHYQLLDSEFDMIVRTAQRLDRRNERVSIINLVAQTKDAFIARGRYDLVRVLLDLAVNAAEELKQCLDLAEFLVSWGYVCSEQGDYHEAKQRLSAGIEKAKTLDDAIVADGYFHLSRIAVDQADYEEASEFLGRCRKIREQLDDELGVARVGYFEAQIFLRVGNYDKGYELARAVYAIQKEFNAMPDLAETLRLLIDISTAQRNYERAWQYCTTLLDKVSCESYQDLQAEAYFCTATVCRYLKLLDQASTYAEQALAIFEFLGNRAFISYVTYELSVIAYNKGDLHTALQTSLTSLAKMKELHDSYSLVFCLQYIGDIYRDLNDAKRANDYWVQARELAVEIHHPRVTLLNERLGIELEKA